MIRVCFAYLRRILSSLALSEVDWLFFPELFIAFSLPISIDTYASLRFSFFCIDFVVSHVIPINTLILRSLSSDAPFFALLWYLIM